MQRDAAHEATPPPAPSATEIVRRPEPGVGRGVWEAPPWMFWAIATACVAGAALYAGRRMGWLTLDRLRRRREARR